MVYAFFADARAKSTANANRRDLTLMKKAIKAVAAILLSVMILSLCACNFKIVPSSLPATKKAAKKTESETEQEKTFYIGLINCTDNPNGVFYGAVSNGQCYYSGINFEPSKFPRETGSVSDDQIEYFISYINGVKDPEFYDDQLFSKLIDGELKDHTLLFTLNLTYRDDTREVILTKYIFDEYPEGFGEFLKKFNALFGAEIMTQGEPLKPTAELFTRVTGLTDKDFEGMTIDEYLDKYSISTFNIIHYYTADKNSGNNMKYIPVLRALNFDIRSVESSDEEFRQYVEDVAAKFQAADPDHKSCKTMYYDDGSARIQGDKLSAIVFKSCKIPEHLVWTQNPPHVIYEEIKVKDGGTYDESIYHVAFVSNDGKFVIETEIDARVGFTDYSFSRLKEDEWKYLMELVTVLKLA